MKLTKILENTNVSYSAVVLTEKSQNKLKDSLIEAELLNSDNLTGFKLYCHHMTINLGPIQFGLEEKIGQPAEITVVSFAEDDKVKAVGVESDIPSKNAQKHITVAVNFGNGGKPFLSNKLTNWVPLENPIKLQGIIEEVPFRNQ